MVGLHPEGCTGGDTCCVKRLAEVHSVSRGEFRVIYDVSHPRKAAVSTIGSLSWRSDVAAKKSFCEQLASNCWHWRCCYVSCENDSVGVDVVSSIAVLVVLCAPAAPPAAAGRVVVAVIAVAVVVAVFVVVVGRSSNRAVAAAVAAAAAAAAGG